MGSFHCERPKLPRIPAAYISARHPAADVEAAAPYHVKGLLNSTVRINIITLVNTSRKA